METLAIIIECLFKLILLGIAVLLNVFVWGGIAVIFKRGKKNGNNKNIH